VSPPGPQPLRQPLQPASQHRLQQPRRKQRLRPHRKQSLPNPSCPAQLGVGESLKSGTWTLFAPNNEAFLKLPPDYVDVVTSNNEQLKKLLLFHAVPGTALYAEDLPCRAGENLLEMANGKDTRTICEDVRPREPFPKYQKGNFNCDDKPPEIIVTDVGACNGVIHAIDDVMLYREPN